MRPVLSFPGNLGYIPGRSNNLGEWRPKIASQLLRRPHDLRKGGPTRLRRESQQFRWKFELVSVIMIPSYIKRMTSSPCSTAISKRVALTSMLWSSAVLRSICSVLFRGSRRIATFCSQKYGRRSPKPHKLSRVRFVGLVVTLATNGSIMDRRRCTHSFRRDGKIAFKRHFLVGRSTYVPWHEKISYAQSYLLSAIVALISWTASRLRPIKRNWTRSFRGWSNRTPILSGQRMFV